MAAIRPTPMQTKTRKTRRHFRSWRLRGDLRTLAVSSATSLAPEILARCLVRLATTRKRAWAGPGQLLTACEPLRARERGYFQSCRAQAKAATRQYRNGSVRWLLQGHQRTT